jgi:CDP-diacylglycerol---glycerol-3-phosphate 3-phosphatidyltransferase
VEVAADRAVEIVLWVAYAHLRLIPVVIPITVIIRGALTDSFRSQAAREGQSAHTMMHSRLGHWLVASSPMRSSYAVTKALAFILLALALGARSGGYGWEQPVWVAAIVLSWIALALCILRGLPVIVQGTATLASRRSRGQAPPEAQG